MSLIFFPPDPPRPQGVLRRWAATMPQAWVKAILEATTQPGELVLDPFCQGDTVARVALRLGRSVAVADFNPVQTLAARAAITPPAPQTLARATLRLAEAVKLDRPLREAIQALYLTRCPHCGADTPAETFTWDATAHVPTRKTVACGQCGWRGAAPASPDDVARANEMDALSLSYHFLAQRLAAQTDTLYPLAEKLLGLYSPRAIRALADLIRNLDHLELSVEEGEALRMVLLGCLDACSSLNATAWDTSPPRRLEPPRRYVELNVWYAFETVAASLRETAPAPDAEWVSAADQLLTGTSLPYGFIGRLPARGLAEVLPGRASLIIGAPPRMTALFWTLSWAWASWLWSGRAAAPLRSLVERPGVGWDWYATALYGALTSLRSALTPTGRIALRWTGDQDAQNAVLLAATRAGFRLEQSVIRLPRPGARWLEAQALLSRQPETPARTPFEQFNAVSQSLEESAATLAGRLIAAQGQPLGADTLIPAALADTAQTGVLAQAMGLFDEPALGLEFAEAKLHDGLAVAVARHDLTRLDDGRLWRPVASEGAPLVERVEQAVIEGLQREMPHAAEGASPPTTLGAGEADRLMVTLTLTDLYAAFPGPIAPDTELMNLCLETHGQMAPPGVWTSQPMFEALRLAVHDLVILGEALGYTVQFPLPWAIQSAVALSPVEVIWYAGGRPTTRFVLQASALLAPHTTSPPLPIPHYLVIPERGARLARLKLQRAPHLAEALSAHAWRFIVAERLHHWITRPLVDAEEWQDIVGLDERTPGPGQLRLFERPGD